MACMPADFCAVTPKVGGGYAIIARYDWMLWQRVESFHEFAQTLALMH